MTIEEENQRLRAECDALREREQNTWKALVSTLENVLTMTKEIRIQFPQTQLDGDFAEALRILHLVERSSGWKWPEFGGLVELLKRYPEN